MAEDQIRLNFKYVGAEDAAALQARHETLKEQVIQLAAALGRNELSWAEYQKQMRAVSGETAAVERAMNALDKAAQREAEAAQHTAHEVYDLADAYDLLEAETAQLAATSPAAAAAVTKVGDAAKSTAKASRDTDSGLRTARQGFLDVSRAIQDFAQGGFGGILNNLEGVGRGLTAMLKNPAALLTSLPAILTTVGTAIYVFGGQVWNAFKGFALGANEIPKATDALGKIDERMKEVNKQLETYREKQKLTNAELVEYNKLSAEQVVLERQKVKAMEDQAAAKRVQEANPSKEQEEKERKDLFDETLGTPAMREQLAQSVVRALPQNAVQEALGKLNAAKQAQANHVPLPDDIAEQQELVNLQKAVDGAQAALKKAGEGLRAQADKLVADALGKGNRQATEAIQGMMNRQATVDQQTGARNVGPGPFSDFQVFAFDNANVDAHRKEKNEQEQDKRLKKLDDDLAKKREAEDKIDEEWYQYSLELEKELANDRKKDFAEKLKEQIDALKRIGKVDEIAAEYEAEAKKLGLKLPGEIFDHVRAGMERAIVGAVQMRGLAIPDEFMGFAKQQAGGLARQAAGQAQEQAEKQEGKDAKGDVKDEDKARKAQRKFFDESGLTAQAGSLYALARANKATPDQAFNFVTKQALKFLNRQMGVDRFGRPVRANAGMSDEQKNLLASQGRSAANEGVAKLAGQNLNNTGKLLSVANQLDGEVARMQMVQQQQGQAIEALQRRGQARQRTALKRP